MSEASMVVSFDEYVEFLASIMLESDNAMLDWHHAPVEERDSYRRTAIRILNRLRDVVLREAAAKIRRELPDPNPLARLFGPSWGAYQAADLIDPDVQTRP